MSCPKCNQWKCCCKTAVQYREGQRRVVKIENKAGKDGLASIPVKHTAFVMGNGNDVTGKVERFDKPFATINAATTALLSAYPSMDHINRSQVIVYAGKYTQNVYLKKYVDLHFYDVNLDGIVTDNFVDFGSSPDGYYTNIITGDLKIRNTSSAGFVLYKPGSKVLARINTISSVLNDAVVIQNGNLKLYAEQIFTENTETSYDYPVELAQGYDEPDFTESIVEIIGANIYNLDGGQQATIGFNSGSTSKNQKLILRNCRVKNDGTSEFTQDKACISIGPILSSDARITLIDTILFSHNGPSISVLASNTCDIKYYNTNMANSATSVIGTLNVGLGSLTINAAVEAEF